MGGSPITVVSSSSACLSHTTDTSQRLSAVTQYEQNKVDSSGAKRIDEDCCLWEEGIEDDSASGVMRGSDDNIYNG